MYDAGLEKRGIDPLAAPGSLALDHGGEHAHGGQDAGRDVSDRGADLDRWPPGAFAGNAHQPTHALGDQIEAATAGIGPGPSKAGDPAVDQARVVLAKRVVTNSQAVHGAGPVVLDQRVRRTHQTAQHGLAALALEVYGDAAFVAVDHQEGRRLAADVRWQGAARIVAAGHLLDLDHLGAHVGQHQPADRSGHDVSQLDHLEPRKRSPARGHISLPFFSICYAYKRADLLALFSFSGVKWGDKSGDSGP